MKTQIKVWTKSSAVEVSHGGRAYAGYASLDHALIHFRSDRLSVSDCGGYVVLSGTEWVEPLLIEFHHADGMWIRPSTVLSRMAGLEQKRANRLATWHRQRYDESTFRRDPVPGTGGARYANWLRYMRTTQERRAAAYADAGEPKPRAKRNETNLPNAWDDIRRSSERSWKSHRRSQWKEKA